MYNILSFYIKKVILLNILTVFLILVFLSSIIRLLDSLKYLEERNYSIYKMFLCTFLSLPKDFELFFPIAILLGGLLGLSMLDVHNELMIMQILGLSKLKISTSVIQAVVIILFCNIISSEWLLPYSHQIISKYQNNAQYNTYLFPERNKNLWFIDINNLVSVDYMVAYDTLLGVRVFYLEQDRKINRMLCVERAIYVDKMWSLFEVTEFIFTNNTCIISKNKSYSSWITTLTPHILSIVTIHPRVLSISKLMFCIKYFNKVHQNSEYYQLIFWNKIFSPIIGLVMIIIALLYSFGPFIRKKLSIRLFFGSIIGFLFYILYQICGSLSIMYHVSPLSGYIIFIVLFFIINLIFVWKYI